MKFISPRATNIVLVVILLAALGSAGAQEAAGKATPALPAFITEATTLKKVGQTPKLGFKAFHVQGLVVTEKYFIFTSVNKPGFGAWLFKVDRKTMKLVDKKNMARVMDFHPGGIDFDGHYIWNPVAVYSPRSHTNVMVVDPGTFKFKKAFEVEDHIGAVARLDDKVIAANWDAESFYFFTPGGKLIEKKPSPTGGDYQDCKGEYGFLMCNGGGYLDWIDVNEWKLVKRFKVEKSELGSLLSREGAALYNGHVFFLPDDGADGRIYEYEFVKEEKKGSGE